MDILAKYEIIKAKVIQRKLNFDESTEGEETEDSTPVFFNGNTRLPFGLCKEYGITIGDNWKPKDAWEALKGKGISKDDVYEHLKNNGTVSNYKPSAKATPKPTPKNKGIPTADELKNDKIWNYLYDKAYNSANSLCPKDANYSKGIDYKGDEVDLTIQTKECQQLFNQISNDDNHIPINVLISHPAIKQLDNLMTRIKSVIPKTELINNDKRDKLRDRIIKRYQQIGSAVNVGTKKNPKYEYTGEIKKEYKACLVLGLPGCGKSSIATDKWSAENGAFISDCDIIKTMMPEYQATNGLAANQVHSESKDLHNKALKEFYKGGSREGDNIAVGILGGSATKLQSMIDEFENAGYDVEIKFVDGDTQKSANRVAARAMIIGRYISPRHIASIGNVPYNNYKKYINKTNKKGNKYIR